MVLSKVIIVIGVVLFFCAGFSSANDKKVWKQEDCKKISDASGHFLVVSGYLLEESGKKKEEGDLKEMEKSFMGAVHFSEMDVIPEKLEMVQKDHPQLRLECGTLSDSSLS